MTDSAELPAHQRAAVRALIGGADPYALERAALTGRKVAFTPVHASQRPNRRTATEILGPPLEPADPHDPETHGWDPDGPGDREREDRP